MLARVPQLWAVILAGGEGAHLAPLTRVLYGTDLPEQFAILTGARSMLQATVDRILPLVPAERIMVSVTRTHEALARQQLAEWGEDITLLVQPRNLGTGPGLLLPLARIRARDPSARVVVLPSDHHVARPQVLLTTIERAELASQMDRSAVTLLAAQPNGPDTDYGWIVPGRHLEQPGMRAVLRFFEKPERQLADDLLRLGAMWNTLIIVGAVEAMWEVSRRYLPVHAETLARSVEPDQLDAAYAALPPVGFSRAVLERARDLSLIPLRGAGWSDWGTPRRVFESLVGTPDHRQLLQRIVRPASTPAMA